MREVSSGTRMFATALLLLQATFQSPRLIESSGVAVSHAYPGVLWTHNDSGDGPYVYATDLHGTDRGALLVPGAQAIDWEDISLRSEEHTSELQSQSNLVCRLLLEKKKKINKEL